MRTACPHTGWTTGPHTRPLQRRLTFLPVPDGNPRPLCGHLRGRPQPRRGPAQDVTMDTVYFRPGNGTRGSAETGACQGHVWSRRAKCRTEPRPPGGAVPGVRPAHHLRVCHSGHGLLGLPDPVCPRPVGAMATRPSTPWRRDADRDSGLMFWLRVKSLDGLACLAVGRPTPLGASCPRAAGVCSFYRHLRLCPGQTPSSPS